MEFLRRLCAPDSAQIDEPVAVICAHPDDETLGVGTRFRRLAKLAIVHVTDGAPSGMEDARRNGFESCEAYSAARRQELEAAVRLGGVQSHQLFVLGFPDQGAAKDLVATTRAVFGFLSRFRPTVVITHPYEGGHPDHDATAFAVHSACRLIEREGGGTPTLVEMTSYHSRAGLLTAGEFLQDEYGSTIFTAWLTPEEQEFKRRMLSCFPTQAAVLAQFPLDRERFRSAPRYNFSYPPHPGTLFYEQFPWGMTGSRFRSHVVQALEELDLPKHLLV